MTVPVSATSLAPAALGPRIIAFIIDAIVLGILGVILGILVGDLGIVSSVARAIIYGALSFAYYGYTWTTSRASPGQQVMGLMTVNAADGAALPWNQAAMRWAYLFGPVVVSQLFTNTNQVTGLSGLVGLAVLGYSIYLLYTTANDPKRQGFHDKKAGTLVVVKTAA